MWQGHANAQGNGNRRLTGLRNGHCKHKLPAQPVGGADEGLLVFRRCRDWKADRVLGGASGDAWLAVSEANCETNCGVSCTGPTASSSGAAVAPSPGMAACTLAAASAGAASTRMAAGVSKPGAKG